MALHARAWRAVIALALAAWWCLAGASSIERFPLFDVDAFFRIWLLCRPRRKSKLRCSLSSSLLLPSPCPLPVAMAPLASGFNSNTNAQIEIEFLFLKNKQLQQVSS